MTPDEQARLARLEAEYKALRNDVRDMSRKIDALCEIAAMGKGAWYASLKIGGVIVILGTAAWTVFSFMKGVR